MNVLIIEDEAPAFRRLQNLIEELDDTIDIIDVIDSVEEAVKWFNNHNLPDLIFMDIQLADGLSFEIFEKVKLTCPIIFTTAFDEYTLKAFKVNSIDYLLKPIGKDELGAALEKWNDMKAMLDSNDDLIGDIVKKLGQGVNYKRRFLVKTGDRLISIDEGDIAYFFTRDALVFVMTKEGKKYVLDQPLDELETLLDPNSYFRLNRQFLSHIDAINSIHQYFRGKLKVHLKPPSEDGVTVSREKSTSFKKWLDG